MMRNVNSLAKNAFLEQPVQTAAVIFLTLGFISILRYLYSRRAILRLGAFAPSVSSYVPFGFDVAYRSVTATNSANDLYFWDWILSFSPRSVTSPTVETYIGGQRYIFTTDPENIKAILTTQFNDYGKGEPFHEEWKDFFGDGIFATDGALWQASRQLIRPTVTKQRISDLETFERHVQKLIALIPKDDSPIDISDLFYRFTLDAATEYLLGESVQSLDNPHVDFANAFGIVQRFMSMISRMGPLKIFAFLARQKYLKALTVINAFVERYVEAVLKMTPEELAEQKTPSFLHNIAATGTRDRKVIRDQCVNILLAGRDTTAGTLSFLFLEIARNPEVFAKLQREIIDTIGLHDAPSYEDLKNMRYLQHTMQETLRLYPSVPMNIRLALRDTTLPRGGGSDCTQRIGILKNTPIIYSTLIMQRREDLYPTDPDLAPPRAFSPERWDKWRPKTWEYIPFNGGPRVCIGQQFALTEMAYTTVRILQQFDKIECFTHEPGSDFKCEVVISPLHGVEVGLRARKQ